ncbi:MAG: transposase, partial [Bacillota bacterium]|nr:transposase [Bacillota bacterium]
MATVYQKNKKTGITYVYDNKPYWDKAKQQSRTKRTLIGKLDPDTGETVPTRKYKNNKKSEPVVPVKPGPVPITKIRRSFYGASYLLDQIGQMTGVVQDLKCCFPDRYKQILSVA